MEIPRTFQAKPNQLGLFEVRMFEVLFQHLTIVNLFSTPMKSSYCFRSIRIIFRNHTDTGGGGV